MEQVGKIVWVTARSSGGGAEAVVRELHHAALKLGVESHWIVLVETETESALENAHFIGANKASSALRLLRAKIRSLNPTVVYANMTYLNILTVLACALLRVKIIGVEHNIVYSPITDHFTKSRMLRLLAKFTYWRLHRVICVSAGVALDVQRYFGVSEARIKVIGNPVRTLKYVPQKPRAFGFIGAHTKQKGLDILAKAYIKYRNEGGKRELIVAGTGPLTPKLKRDLDSANLSDTVEFLGFIDNVQSFYDRVDVVVVPSIWEGFCNVVAEGILTGSQVLASNCHSGPSDICKTLGQGILFEPTNVDELASIMGDEKLQFNVGEITKHPYESIEVIGKYLKCAL